MVWLLFLCIWSGHRNRSFRVPYDGEGDGKNEMWKNPGAKYV